MGSRRLPTTGRPGKSGAGIVRAEVEEEHEGLAVQRLRGARAQEAAQVGRRGRGPVGVLEGPDVDEDADAGRGGRGAPRVAEPHAARRGPRPRSSSQRSWRTTTSASTMIRRLILLWPTRRSRKVIGTSRTRAPPRWAR